MIKFKSKTIEKWVMLFIVAFAGGIITKLPYLKDSYYDVLRATVGITNKQFGFLLTMYGIMNFIVYVPGGMLADRISPKKLIVISCFGTGLVGIWYSMLPSYSALLIIHTLFGITTVFTFWGSMVKITNNMGRYDEQGKLFGVLEGGRGGIGLIVALGSTAVFSYFASETAGMKGAILFYSVMMFVAGILSIIFLQDPEIDKTNAMSVKATFSEYKTVLKIPRVWICGIAVACNYAAVILFGYVTPYLTEVYGMSNSAVAIVGSLRSYGIMLIASLVAGICADKLKSVLKFWTYGYCGMAVLSFGYLLIPGNRELLWIVVVNFALHGMFLYAVKALYFAPIDELMVPKKLAGTASGIISIIGYAPEMFMYTAAGSILDNNAGRAGFNIIFVLCGILSVVGFITVIILKQLNNKYKMTHSTCEAK